MSIKEKIMGVTTKIKSLNKDAPIDEKIEFYDDLIDNFKSMVNEDHLFVSEKLSFVEICAAVLRKMGVDEPTIYERINEFIHNQKKFGESTACKVFSEFVFHLACDKYSHFDVMLALWIGIDSAVNIKEVKSLVDKCLYYQDELLKEKEKK